MPSSEWRTASTTATGKNKRLFLFILLFLLFLFFYGFETLDLLFFNGAFALGIAVEMVGEVTNQPLQRIARPVGERPKKWAMGENKF
jgi:hypothetical protein